MHSHAGVHLQMPTGQLRQTLGRQHLLLYVGQAGLPAHMQIEANASHTACVKLGQCVVAHCVQVHHRHAACARWANARNRIEQTRVVGVVNAGLHQHHTAYTQALVHGQQLLYRCTAWRVRPLGGVGKLSRLKHMDMGVTGVFWEL